MSHYDAVHNLDSAIDWAEPLGEAAHQCPECGAVLVTDRCPRDGGLYTGFWDDDDDLIEWDEVPS
jgi:hypothetical protein